jgi:hypothetical protein
MKKVAGLRRRLSYANVIATLALFFAVGGGVAVAAPHAGSTKLDTYLKSASTSIGAVRQGQVGVACDAGDKALGGGFILSSTDMRVLQSFPSDGGPFEGTTGWTVLAGNSDLFSSHELGVRVLCADNKP